MHEIQKYRGAGVQSSILSVFWLLSDRQSSEVFSCPGRDVKTESGRQRHPSGGMSAKEMVIGLEGVELGADGKVTEQMLFLFCLCH